MSSTTEAPFLPVTTYPRPGEVREIAPGVLWLLTSLPFRLRAINLWLLRDQDGWTMIDCGFPLEEVRTQIEQGWAQALDGLPVTRLVVTHHHADHAGNCAWICQRWGIVPTMTRGTRTYADRIFTTESWDGTMAEYAAFWRRYGLPENQVMNILKGWQSNRDEFMPLPKTWQPIRDGDALRIGDSSWQVITAEGHASEQAVLHSPELGVLISGDQVLTKITPNVSVAYDAPEADPISQFLASNRRIAELCGDVLVLPSHNLPFRGLQARIGALESHHKERLSLLADALGPSPQAAAALIPVLFGELTGHETAFAMGEIVAHLNHLVVQGRAQRLEHDGKVLFAAG